MIKKTLVAIMLLCALGASAETPQEGAQEILTLLKNRNYTDLFQKRYSEWYKTEAEGIKPEEAIKKLSTMYEKNHDMMLNLLSQYGRLDSSSGLQ